MFYILATKCYLPSHSNVFSPNNSNPVLPIVSAKARALYQKPCVSKLTLALTPHCSLHIIVWNYVCGNASCVPPAMLAGSLVWQKVEIIWNKYYYTKYIYTVIVPDIIFQVQKDALFIFNIATTGRATCSFCSTGLAWSSGEAWACMLQPPPSFLASSFSPKHQLNVISLSL